MKQFEKICAIFLVLFLVINTVSLAIIADDGWDGTETKCLNGTGDPNNPFLISTPGELAWFRTQVNTVDCFLCARLTADIDLNNHQWIPIGDVDASYAESALESMTETVFSGVFDGYGHTISGLNINIVADETNYRYIGLFGGAAAQQGSEYAVIKNLTVTGSITIDTSSKNASNVGGICGSGSYLKISNCTSNVTIVSSGGNSCSSVGGIVGSAYKTIDISNCVNVGNIDVGGDQVGGLIGYGYLKDNSILCSCNLGNISGNTKVGGLGGKFSGTVKDCYNTGTITAKAEDITSGGTGGLIGSNRASTNLTMNNCFTIGIVYSNFEDYTGAVYGQITDTNKKIVNFENVFYLDSACDRPCGRRAKQYYETNANTERYKTISMSAEEMSSDEFVTTLNTNSGSTVFKKGSTHPIFVWQTEDAPVAILGDIDGNGTVNASDVSALIAKLEEDEGFILAVDDVDGNGTVNVTDVSELITRITE